MQEHQTALAKYAEMVEQTIDLDQLEHHEFVIKSEYDETLQRLAGEIAEVFCFSFSVYIIVYALVIS
jgi:DNA mismatch repair protein MSH2